MPSFKDLQKLPFTRDMFKCCGADLKMPDPILLEMLASLLHSADADPSVHSAALLKLSSEKCTIAEVLLGALHSYVGATADLMDMAAADSPEEEDTVDLPRGSAVSIAAATKLVVASDRPSMPPFPKGCVTMKQRQDFVDNYYASLKTASSLSTTLTL